MNLDSNFNMNRATSLNTGFCTPPRSTSLPVARASDASSMRMNKGTTKKKQREEKEEKKYKPRRDESNSSAISCSILPANGKRIPEN